MTSIARSSNTPMRQACSSTRNLSSRNYEIDDTEELSEQEEIQLAHELLAVNNEQELEHLGSSQARGEHRRPIAKSPIGKAIGGALKGVAKKALPMAGTALGLVGGPLGAKIGLASPTPPARRRASSRKPSARARSWNSKAPAIRPHRRRHRHAAAAAAPPAPTRARRASRRRQRRAEICAPESVRADAPRAVRWARLAPDNARCPAAGSAAAAASCCSG